MAEAARLLGLSQRTVYLWADRGWLKTQTIGVMRVARYADVVTAAKRRQQPSAGRQPKGKPLV